MTTNSKETLSVTNVSNVTNVTNNKGTNYNNSNNLNKTLSAMEENSHEVQDEMNQPTPMEDNQTPKKKRKLPEWKPADAPSVSVILTNQEDPFGLDEIKPKKERLELPSPVLTWAGEEKNKIQRQLLEEIESKCLSLHTDLWFYETETLNPDDWAQYSKKEAEAILKERSHLNPEQVEAALKCTDDLFIQALAGTGKTSLLSACISYLLSIGTDPEKIAISSHTVTAAEEIKNRILPTLEWLYPKTKEALGKLKPSTGTIHAIAYRDMIFHKHPKARWTILDEAQQFRIWREATLFAFPERANMNISEESLGEEMRLFDRIRGYDIPEENVGKVLHLISEDDELKKIGEIYSKIKEARKLLDYTDLLREWAPIIVHPGYRQKWQYFFVDEFQDTNPLQKFLLKLLKLGGTKLVVCGDNRQSINSFTGSDPTSHEEFFKDFKISEAWLTTNYRCSKKIISLANEVISSMMPPEKGRLKAHENAEEGVNTTLILTRKEDDKRVFLPPKEAEIEKKKEAFTSCYEAVNLLSSLGSKMPEGETPSVAILYRTNAQGGVLEETMAQINTKRSEKGLAPIKYIRKDFRRTALRNKTEREILSVLSCWASPKNTNWETMLLCPYFHGIGEVTARMIQRKSERVKPQTIEETMVLFDKELSKRNAETIGEFFLAWEKATQDSIGESEPKIDSACVAIGHWIAKMASKKSYQKGSKKESEEAQRRSYESSIYERLKEKAKQLKTLSEAIAEINEENEKAIQTQNNANRALGLGSESNKIEKEDGIILSTIHLAKGREYDGVVIHQVSKGSLPHYNAIKFYENDKAEREKRFRKYSSFPELQEEDINYENPSESRLPRVWRTGVQETLPKDKVESWEDHNNPLEEEKRLLYVAITRAKKKLIITSRDHDYEYLPKNLWEKLKKYGKTI
jgi:DNA helicase-2/ATP-dependent DNA helicase PcrA